MVGGGPSNQERDRGRKKGGFARFVASMGNIRKNTFAKQYLNRKNVIVLNFANFKEYSR